MRIALVCPASLPAIQFGGILFLCVDLARELSNLGHDVTIYTTDLDFANNPKFFNKKLPRLEKIEKFKINRTHVWFSLYLFFVNPEMYFQILKYNPDVIHTIGIRSFQSFIAALVSKKTKIPLVISDQGGLTTHPFLRESSLIKKFFIKLQKLLITFIIKQAAKISVANEYEQKIFSNLHAAEKTIIVRNGINLLDFKTMVDFKKKYNIDERYILFVGRFSISKGIDNLLRAISLIKQSTEMQKTKLVIMGMDFGFEKEMYKMIQQLKINDKVMVIKKPAREDVIAAYSSCEFLVLPSRWELSPLVPLEAFAFKKAVISIDSHGIPYTITDGKNGILVEPDNSQSLADAILELINNEKKREEFGLDGYRLVNDICNSKMMAINTLKIYEEVVKNKENKH